MEILWRFGNSSATVFFVGNVEELWRLGNSLVTKKMWRFCEDFMEKLWRFCERINVRLLTRVNSFPELAPVNKTRSVNHG